MRQTVILGAMWVWLAWGTALATGAIITSSNKEPDRIGFSWIPFGSLHNDYRPMFRRNVFFQSGADEMTLSVDTVTNLATITSLDFVPITMTPRTVANSFTVPGQGTFTETYSVTSMTISETPEFVSATPSPLIPRPNGRRYILPPVVLDLPNFTLHGVYEVTAPNSTVSVPFSVEYQADYNSDVLMFIPAGEALVDDFAFDARELRAQYRPIENGVLVNYATLFQGDVEGVPLHSRIGFGIIHLFAPEPSGLGMILLAGLGGIAARRRLPPR